MDFMEDINMSNLTDAEIEAERASIVEATVAEMLSEGAVIAHTTVSPRLEKSHPGFSYIAKQDDFRRHIDDSLPVVEPPAAVGSYAGLARPEPEPIVPDAVGIGSEPEPMAPEALRTALDEAEEARAQVRGQLYTAAASRTIARTILAQTIQTFISGRPAVTPLQAAQAYCAASAAERATQKEQGAARIPEGGRSKWALESSRAWARSGDPATRQLKRGSARGALPASMQGQRLPVTVTK
jgi:hypothetical protein